MHGVAELKLLQNAIHDIEPTCWPCVLSPVLRECGCARRTSPCTPLSTTSKSLLGALLCGRGGGRRREHSSSPLALSLHSLVCRPSLCGGPFARPFMPHSGQVIGCVLPLHRPSFQLGSCLHPAVQRVQHVCSLPPPSNLSLLMNWRCSKTPRK